LVDDAADPVAAGNSGRVDVGDGCWEGPERSSLIKGPVGPVLVVMALVLAEDVQQVALVPDQRPVEEFAAAAAGPPLHDRVRPRGWMGLRRIRILVAVNTASRRR
jgi:hypothetical protein